MSSLHKYSILDLQKQAERNGLTRDAGFGRVSSSQDADMDGLNSATPQDFFVTQSSSHEATAPAAPVPSVAEGATGEQSALGPTNNTQTPTTTMNHDEINAHASGIIHPFPQSADDHNHVGAGHQDPADAMHPSATLGEPFPPMLPQDFPSDMAVSDNPLVPVQSAMDPISADEAVRRYNTMEAEMKLAEMESLPPPEQRISAFAKLKFLDGEYYMTTYQVELGRDIVQAHEAMRRMMKYQKALKKSGQNSGDASHMPSRKRKRARGTSNTARSIVSESGGIVKVPVEALPVEYRRRRKSDVSQSASSSSHHYSHGNPLSQQNDAPDNGLQAVMMETFPPVPQHLEHLVPDPNDCPFVPIHPQQITAVSGHKGPKGISRKHARISYNFELGQFELTVLGANGLFCQNIHHRPGDVVPLKHNDFILIGAVEIWFQLPNDPLTDEEPASEDESCSRPMSFEFQNGRGESEHMEDDSAEERQSLDPRYLWQARNGYESDKLEDDDDEDGDEEDGRDATPDDEPKKQTVRLKMSLKHSQAKSAQRKKGKKVKHQRPPPKPAPKAQPKPKPKESIKELPKEKPKTQPKESAKDKLKEKNNEPPKPPVKEEQPKQTVVDVKEKPKDQPKEGTVLTADDIARFGLPESMIGQTVQKRKGPGRPPKDGFMSKREKALLARQAKEAEKARKLGLDPSELPPPTKTKPGRPQKDSRDDGDGDELNVKDGAEGQGGNDGPLNADQTGDKKPTKSAKPPRSPSPEMKESDYTEQELQRPAANYVILIHEAISSSKTGAMNLQQIYSAIERKYPYYKFRVTTNGWQSSVRHNLGQHEAFKKADKEGKGYNWVIDPTVSIEKERRKRASPPPQPQPQQQRFYHPPAQYPMLQHHGMQGSYYPPYPPYPHPPQAAPADASARVGTPDNKDGSTGARPFVPRLPPSLATSNAPANVPTTQSASPYASPWAGGNDTSPKGAGNTPTTQAGDAYPPHPPYSPVNSAPPGSYSILVTTLAPYPYVYTTAGPYPPQYAGAPLTPSQFSGPPRPYSPYVTSGASQSSPYAPNPQLQPQNQPQPQASSQSRYPPHITPAMAEQLDAFRNTFIARSTEDKAFAERKVDNAINHIVSPSDSPATLIAAEQELVNIIKKILGDDVERRAPQNETEKQGQEQQQNPPAGRTLSELATSAATIAASSAAATDSKSTEVVPPSAEPASKSASHPPKSEIPAQPPSILQTHPASAQAKVQRPSVEPLTPVPGSPMVAPNAQINGVTTPTPGAKRTYGEMTKVSTDIPEQQAEVERTVDSIRDAKKRAL